MLTCGSCAQLPNNPLQTPFDGSLSQADHRALVHAAANVHNKMTYAEKWKKILTSMYFLGIPCCCTRYRPRSSSTPPCTRTSCASFLPARIQEAQYHQSCPEDPALCWACFDAVQDFRVVYFCVRLPCLRNLPQLVAR